MVSNTDNDLTFSFNDFQMKRFLRHVKDFREICINYKYTDSSSGLPEYKTGTICGNIVGDRIRYIKDHDKRLNYTVIAKQAGISRDSLMRYLQHENPDIPKAQTLLDIITKGLHCNPDDFCYSPENFSVWEEAFSKALNLSITKTETRHSYETLKKEMESKILYGRWTYEDCGTTYPIPKDIMDVFRKQISAAFITIEYLLNYEMKSNKPRGFVEPYLIETIPGFEDD